MSHRSISALCVLHVTGLLTLSCNLQQAEIHRPKRAQRLTGNENVLIIAPAELLHARVKVDGQSIGYLWSLDHMLSSGIDHVYQPVVPVGTKRNVSATRLHIDEGHHV